jgi:phosphate transport system permease protein
VTQSTTKAQQQGGPGGPDFKASKSTRYGLDMAFTVLVTGAALVGVVVLVVLLIDVIRDGSTMLSLKFLTSFPSQIFPENGGIYPALIGSLWLLGLTALISVPLGLGAAVYLEEYAEDTRINRIIEINISNLAGVPSVIYGLLGLGIFVELLAPVTGGGSVLTGALTLSLLILPVIIVATREALRAIPGSIREGGYALGATKWEVIWSHLLPMALPGALTGHRRGGPDPGRRSLAIPDIRHHRTVRRLHGAAHPDLRLDQPPAADLPGLRRGRHSGGHGGVAAGELVRDLAAKQVPAAFVVAVYPEERC